MTTRGWATSWSTSRCGNEERRLIVAALHTLSVSSDDAEVEVEEESEIVRGRPHDTALEKPRRLAERKRELTVFDVLHPRAPVALAEDLHSGPRRLGRNVFEHGVVVFALLRLRARQ